MKNLSISEDDINDDTIDEASEIVGIAYGNLIVFNRNWIHLSIGPDYPFTIIAIIFLTVISYALYFFQTMLTLGIFGKIVNLIFVLIPPISFLITALRNPGVYNIYENNQPKIKYCEICKVFKPKKVFHCNRCDVCIQDFDHHCPWLSKCVGGKNITSFYVFVLSLPLAFFYFGYLIYIAVTTQNKQ